METFNFDEMEIELEQQLIGIKDDHSKLNWRPRPQKTKSGYRTMPLGNALAGILKRAKKRQLENCLKYGEFYKQDPEHDYVCKKENGEHCTPSVIKYNTRKIKH
ncbi:hypothetical protein ACQKOF_09015 [Lysinibacillus sp. NPDC093190]|uniref:hypothetical protein n=1 Tax=Lysinibacillus sp. NPDC093190 TaxID=3390575 RepID=UPI003D004907